MKPLSVATPPSSLPPAHLANQSLYGMPMYPYSPVSSPDAGELFSPRPSYSGALSRRSKLPQPQFMVPQQHELPTHSATNLLIAPRWGATNNAFGFCDPIVQDLFRSKTFISSETGTGSNILCFFNFETDRFFYHHHIHILIRVQSARFSSFCHCRVGRTRLQWATPRHAILFCGSTVDRCRLSVKNT